MTPDPFPFDGLYPPPNGFEELIEQFKTREKTLDAPRPRRRRRQPEAKVQKEIVHWLLTQGVVLAITDAGLLARMGLEMSCGIPTGWPDITGCLPYGGRFLGVECKAPGKKQTPAQVHMQQHIEKCGGIYMVARSLAELKGEFRKEEKLGNSFGFSID